MAYNVTKARERRAKAVVDCGEDGCINLEFYPERLTPEHQGLVDEAAKSPDVGPGDTMAAMLVPLIADWDVMVDVPVAGSKTSAVLKQEKLEISAKGLKHLPYHIVSKIMDEVNKATTPGEAPTPASEGSFS